MSRCVMSCLAICLEVVDSLDTLPSCLNHVPSQVITNDNPPFAYTVLFACSLQLVPCLL